MILRSMKIEQVNKILNQKAVQLSRYVNKIAHHFRWQ